MPPCQGGCREFEPRLPLHKEEGFQTFFFIAFMSVCNLCVIVQTKLIQKLVKLKHKKVKLKKNPFINFDKGKLMKGVS